MTGLRDRLSGVVGFILDPTPRSDRQIVDFKSHPDDDGRQARVYERLIVAGWLDAVEWPTLDEVNARHPRSTAGRLRPYDWQAEHSWPVEGWVLS